MRAAIAGMLMLPSSIAAAQSGSGNPAAPAPSQASAPTYTARSSTVAPVSLAAVSRDVCAKHPNLKQCS
jgi:hypothetical protein